MTKSTKNSSALDGNLKNSNETQRQLQESEEKTRRILESAVDGIISINALGLIQTVNNSALKMFGYSTEELLQKNIKMLMPSPHQEQHDGYLENFTPSRQAKIIGVGREVHAMRKDGTRFPIHLSVSQFQAGGKRYFAGIVRDITQTKEAEARINKQNEELAGKNWIQEGITNLAIAVADMPTLGSYCDTVISSICTRIEAAAGLLYLADKKHGLSLASGYAVSGREQKFIPLREGIVGQAAAEKKSLRLSNLGENDLKISTSFGQITPQEVWVFPLLDKDEIIGVLELATLKGFTPQQTSFINQILNLTALGLIAAQSREKVTELLSLAQAQTEELQAQAEELNASNEELREKSEEMQVQQETLAQSNEELEEQSQQLEEQKANLERMNSEVTRAKQLVEEQVEQLETASRYKSEFLANMSHELRTPLNSISILAHVLSENRSGNLCKEEVQHAKTIYSSGSDLLKLINDILDLSKVESGNLEMEVENVLISEVLESLERTFKLQFESKKVEFQILRAPDIPVSIVTDQLRLEQVLKNLLSNALKFTQTGHVRLSLNRPKSDTQFELQSRNPKTTIALSVEDTGIGIPADKLALVFEAFRQVDGTTSRKYGGTGLGLSIARSFAEKLGGELHLQSTEGKGSLFTLFLPERLPQASTLPAIVNREKDAQAAPPLLPPSVSQRAPIEAPIRRSTLSDDRSKITKKDKVVLIIENDLTFSTILLDFCHERGYLCLRTDSGEEGLKDAAQYRPVAILLDIGLIDGNDLSVLTRLKDNPVTAKIPVHVISGFENKKEILNLGAHGYQLKPVSKGELSVALDQLLEFSTTQAKKVLLIEDSKAQQEAVRALIEDTGISTVVAESVNQAMALIKKEYFDCIILDLNLPGQSGFEFLKLLNQDPLFKKPPIIVHTGRELSHEELQTLESYSDSIIIKGTKAGDRLLEEVTLFLHRVNQKELASKRNDVAKEIQTEDAFFHKKILIVDDDTRNVYALRSVLENRGAELLVGYNGLEALELLKCNPDVDLVLMDIMMPEMDGLAAITEIRKNNIKLPIIALTAKAMKGDREKCLKVGASDYISKPIDSDQLINTLRIWLSS